MDYNKIQDELIKKNMKSQKRKMRVSGKSVFKIQEIIKKKAKSK